MNKKHSGIYQILCVTNNKRYIGASTSLSRRKSQHFSELRLNKHRNPRLQADFNEMSEESFLFSVLEIVDDKYALFDREQYWIDTLFPEYNAELKAGYAINHVKKLSVRRKISKTVKDLWKDPKYRAKQSSPEVHKARKPFFESQKGVKRTKAQKEHLSKINSGENNPNYGKPRSNSFLKKVQKTYSGVISPDGIVYSPIIGLNAFCREHNLDNGAVSKLLQGKVQSYKGWTKYNEK